MLSFYEVQKQVVVGLRGISISHIFLFFYLTILSKNGILALVGDFKPENRVFYLRRTKNEN